MSRRGAEGIRRARRTARFGIWITGSALMAAALPILASGADLKVPATSRFYWERYGGLAPIGRSAFAAQADPAPQAAAPAASFAPWWSGRFEADAHLSTWSVDPLIGLFKKDLSRTMATEIRDLVVDELRTSRQLPGNTLSNSLDIDSSGSNLGFGARYYPGGEGGSFSVGLSFERTSIRMTVKGPVRLDFHDGSVAEVKSDATVETKPSALHVDFRWDMAARSRVAPYFTLGLGLASFAGTAVYAYEGSYAGHGSTQTVRGGETKTFVQLAEDGTVHLPDRIVILHLGFGVRARIFRGLGVRGEAAVWDGLILRGGVFYRF